MCIRDRQERMGGDLACEAGGPATGNCGGTSVSYTHLLGIALAENNEIVLRASAGAIKPDVGQCIQRDSAFSGACFRTAQVIRCDDTETDDRVNRYACRQLGARSVVAVPLCGRRRVIGLLEVLSLIHI